MARCIDDPNPAHPERGAVRRLVSGVVALGIVTACTAPAHVFPGRLFDPAAGCVHAIATIDTLDGAEPGANCAVVCLLGPSTDGGERPIYVTSECPPFPRQLDSSGTDPSCPRALEAFARGPACEADAGADASRDDAGDGG